MHWCSVKLTGIALAGTEQRQSGWASLSRRASRTGGVTPMTMRTMFDLRRRGGAQLTLAGESFERRLQLRRRRIRFAEHAQVDTTLHEYSRELHRSAPCILASLVIVGSHNRCVETDHVLPNKLDLCEGPISVRV